MENPIKIDDLGVPITRWWFHFFYFHHYLGKISHLTNIFQMGWNHQPDNFRKHPYISPLDPHWTSLQLCHFHQVRKRSVDTVGADAVVRRTQGVGSEARLFWSLVKWMNSIFVSHMRTSVLRSGHGIGSGDEFLFHTKAWKGHTSIIGSRRTTGTHPLRHTRIRIDFKVFFLPG